MRWFLHAVCLSVLPRLLGTGMLCQGVLAQEITPIGTIGHVFWLWNEWIFFFLKKKKNLLYSTDRFILKIWYILII